MQVPAYLSVANSVYVSIEQLSGMVGEDVDLSFELKELRQTISLTNSQKRQDVNREALEFSTLTGPTVSRLLLAAIYYRQAQRLRSILESRVPELNTSEVLVNLTKSLEILFGNSRDEIRRICKILGFSDRDVEGQIIPLILIRNELDGAHAVGTRINDEMISVLRDYVERASYNVSTIIVRVARLISIGNDPLTPLDIMKTPEQDKLNLLDRMREYLNEMPLNNTNP